MLYYQHGGRDGCLAAACANAIPAALPRAADSTILPRTRTPSMSNTNAGGPVLVFESGIDRNSDDLVANWRWN